MTNMLLVHHPSFWTIFPACVKEFTFIKTYILPPQDTEYFISPFYSHTIYADLVLKKKACLSQEEAFFCFCMMCSYVEDANSCTLVSVVIPNPSYYLC